jgi:hypothetical protein
MQRIRIIDAWRRAGAVLVALIASGVVATACTGGAQQFSPSPEVAPIATLPPEADVLGLEVDPVIPLTAVAEADAIASVNAQFGFDKSADKVEAWLRRVTHPSAGGVLTDRAVWIVHYTGLSIESGSVPRADGTVTPGRILTQAWVFIDAETGAHIMNQLVE